MTKSTITREPITHDLKIYPEFFSAVCTGVKRAELRKNDRDYRVGDTLHLMETPRGSCHQTGEFINVIITHIADVGEWMPGYVLLSVELQESRKADSEPVAWTDEAELRDVDRGGCGYLFTVNPVTPHADERRIILLYRHAQPAREYGDVYQGAREDLAIWKRRALEAEERVRKLEQINDHLVKEAQGESRMGEPVIAQPAPVVPEDVLDALQKVARIRLDLNDFDGDRRGIADCLGDAEEALIEVVNRRAAMLQAGNSPVIPDSSADMLRRWLTFGRGMQNAGSQLPHNLIAETESMLAAAPQSPGSEPATVPGKWIPVSERMPIEFEAVIAFDGDQVYGEAMYSSDDGFTIDGYEPCDRLNLQNVTYWMPLPAAPQEVKGE